MIKSDVYKQNVDCLHLPVLFLICHIDCPI
jgi:hypothetical protein